MWPWTAAESEAPPPLPERGDRGPQQSVGALVSSYQQKMSRSWQEQNRGAVWPQERLNNNWQPVESTAHFYSASELGQWPGRRVRSPDAGWEFLWSPRAEPKTTNWHQTFQQ